MTQEPSAPAQAFVRFVESNPECLDRSSFRALDSPNAFIPYPLNSWPTFIDAAEASEVERVSIGFSRLIKSIPQRFFGCDPVKLGDFYGFDAVQSNLMAKLLQRPGCQETAVGRGDFLETDRGLQCLEFNITGNLGGGWGSGVVADLYRQVPVLRRFLDDGGFEVDYVDTLRRLYAHILTSWETYQGPFGDELNILFLVRLEGPTPDRRQDTDPAEPYLGRVYREVQTEMGLFCGGTVIVAPLGEVQDRGGRLFVGETRVHVVVEFLKYPPEPIIVKSMLTRNSLVLVGPVNFALGDKKNLALLSEQADSPMFDDEERELIRNHLPWTRAMVADHAIFSGRRVFLPDLLVAERERLVLKTRRGSRGQGVMIGRYTEPEPWAEAVRKALEDGLSIVQELVEPSPRPHQIGASGAVPCDVVWGLFVFGDTFAGSFLRLAPSGGRGVINSAQGAEESMVFVASSGSQASGR